MRSTSLAILSVLAISCAPKQNNENETAKAETFDAVAPPSLDSAIFIAEANYFPDTKEFYTPVFYQNSVQSSDPYEHLDTAQTSTSNGYTRKKLPLGKAGTFFYLKNMDTLMFFGKNHQLISKATLSTIEYIDDNIESQYVAVYKPLDSMAVEDNFVYCLNTAFPVKKIEGFSASIIEDEGVTAQILDKLKVREKAGWTVSNVKVSPGEKIYSIVTKDFRSLIVESSAEGVAILKEVNNEYHFRNMFPLPISVNGKPVLLISYYVPESDINGNFTAAFDGTAYHEVHFSRIPVRDF